MALFQTSVLKTYLAQQDATIVERAYKKHTKYFHNVTIQENIKNSKEEQYQAKFLDELFVNVLGYTLNPKPNFNVTTEFKNQKGAGKAGGIPLTKKDEFEWLELFEVNKNKAQELKTQITQTEKDIDDMVYDLYGLTQEERDIVENS